MAVFQQNAPINWQDPIVDPKTGRAADWFQRQWQQMFGNTDFTQGEIDEKLNDIASSRVLGSVGGGAVEQLTITQVLDMLTGAVQGDVIYRGVSAWDNLPPGTSGQFLQTQGAGANPQWAGGGAGAVTLISEQSPSGIGTVTFSGISAAYRDLRIVVRGRGDAVATSVQPTIRFNNDSGANYARNRNGAAGTATVSSGVGRGDTAIINTGNIPAASATADYAGAITFDVMNYRDTTFHKVVLFQSGYATANTDAGHQLSSNGTGFWRNTAAINRIDVILSAGNFLAGSVVSLYGII